jgi:hypothetical protein
LQICHAAFAHLWDLQSRQSGFMDLTLFDVSARMGAPMADDLFPLAKDETPYRKITGDYVSVDTFKGQEILSVEPEGIRLLSEAAFADINHSRRSRGHRQ